MKGKNMQTKTKIDRNTRTLILKYIRKYESYKQWYEDERDKILCVSSQDLDNLDMPRGTTLSDSTSSSAEMLEKLDSSHRATVVKAIEDAREALGYEIADEKARGSLKLAIWLSCIDGRMYPFEAFAGTVCYERTQFYTKKNEFIASIGSKIGI